MNKTMGRIGIFVMIVVGFIGWRVMVRKPPQALRPRADVVQAVPVEIVRVRRGNMEDLLQLTGDIRGFSEAKVFARAPGRLAEKVREVGAVVKLGEVLARVDRDEPSLKFAMAEATAPLAGVVTRYFVDLGTFVTPATPLCEVAEVDPVKVIVHVIEKDLVRVKTGMHARFRVDGYPHLTFTGRVSRISEALESATRSADVEILAPNPDGRLKPGMFARVDVVLADKPGVLMLPRRAVRETGETASVFTVKDGRAVFQTVELGIIQYDQVEVRKGLREGQPVVLVGWQNLTDGMAVEVVAESSSPAKR